MDAKLPSPPPLDYASPAPPKPRANFFLILLGLLRSKTTRVIYLIICAIGMFFVLRFLLHYRQLLEDAMHPK